MDTLESELYRTRDMETVVTLWARGHEHDGEPEVEGSVLYYLFPLTDVSNDVHRLRFGYPLEVNAKDFWKAFRRFKRELRVYLRTAH